MCQRKNRRKSFIKRKLSQQRLGGYHKMSESNDTNLHIKATLLAEGLIRVTKETLDFAKSSDRKLGRILTDLRNLYSSPWLFFLIDSKIRARMIIDPEEKCEFELLPSRSDGDKYIIVDRKANVITEVAIEDSLYHCPDQIFYNLYTWCSNDCAFCPLAKAKPRSRDTVSTMVKVANSFDKTEVKAIGVTTGIPSHLSSTKLIDEMVKAVETLRKTVGAKIPIGVSPYACSRNDILQLYSAGANEIRINLETYNPQLHELLCPNKNLNQILVSLESAVDIFGKNHVSSNMILGLGEDDEDMKNGLIGLCNRGVIPTVYPLDPIPAKMEIIRNRSDVFASRPKKDRLLHIAYLHRDALISSGLDPTQLKTMCPACTASHIMPGFDL